MASIGALIAPEPSPVALARHAWYGADRMRCLIALGLATLAACAGPGTLAWLTFDADEPSAAQAGSLAVRVCNDEGDVVLDRRYAPPSWPFRIELTPRDGDTERRYFALAELFDPLGALIARERLLSGYERDRELEHVIDFEQSCLFELGCSDVESCANGSCVAVQRPPVADATPPPFGCRAIPIDEIDCASPDALLCDGFEAPGALDRWYLYHPQGTLSIAGDGARGMHSLAASSAAEAAEAFAAAPFTSPSAIAIHARARVLVRSGTSFAHAEIMRLQQEGPRSGFGIQVIGPGESRTGELSLVRRDGTSERDFLALPFPFDEWFCVAMSIEIAASGTVTVDRGPAGAVTIRELETRGDPARRYDEVLLGIVYGTGAGLDVQLDDVVVSTRPLACTE